MKISSRRSPSEKGGALLTVLWVSAALAAIAFSVSTSIRAETDRASTAADGLRATYLATGSVDRATQWLLWGTGSDRFFDRQHYVLSDLSWRLQFGRRREQQRL